MDLAAYDDRLRLKTNLDRIKNGKALAVADIHEMVIHTGLEPITDVLRQIIEAGNETEDLDVENPKATAFVVFLTMSNSLHHSGDFQRSNPGVDLMGTLHGSVARLLKWQKP